MALIDDIITQLKNAPVFNNNVAGAADYYSIKDSVTLPTPYAFVTISKYVDRNEDQPSLNGLNIFETIVFSIIVLFSNAPNVATGDRRGQGTVEQLETVRFQIFKQLANWNPNNIVENPQITDDNPTIGHGIRGLYPMGANLVEFDNARLYWVWDFGLDLQISDADGWQEAGVPLEEITISIDSATDNSQLAYSVAT